jgi:hypothetical protein
LKKKKKKNEEEEEDIHESFPPSVFCSENDLGGNVIHSNVSGLTVSYIPFIIFGYVHERRSCGLIVPETNEDYVYYPRPLQRMLLFSMQCKNRTTRSIFLEILILRML